MEKVSNSSPGGEGGGPPLPPGWKIIAQEGTWSGKGYRYKMAKKKGGGGSPVIDIVC